MILFIVRKVLSAVLLVLVATAIAFVLVSASGGDIARTILGPEAGPEQIALKNAELGLDRPLIEQYLSWLGHAVQGDLGRSYFLSERVTTAVALRAPVTLSVVILATVMTAVLSTALGAAAAVFGGVVDKIVQFIALLGHIFPSLLIAVFVVIVVAVNLRWLPATGFIPFTQSPSGWLSTAILPAFALTAGGFAAVCSQVRGSMIDELRRDYTRTLLSRGISHRAVVLRHALRNAAGPGLAILSVQFVALLGGAVVVESVFALPGLGAFTVAASRSGDIPVIMGVTAFVMVAVVLVNVLVDVVNAWLNPKVRVR